jgi:fission process protein 1
LVVLIGEQPAFTIHSIVRYSSRALKDSKNVTLRRFGPIGLGLSAVPALPFLFDKPVEAAVEYVFHTGFELVGGKEAVGDTHPVGREKELEQRYKKSNKGDKEL